MYMYSMYCTCMYNGCNVIDVEWCTASYFNILDFCWERNFPILAVGEVQTLRDAGEMRARQITLLLTHRGNLLSASLVFAVALERRAPTGGASLHSFNPEESCCCGC